MRACRDDNAVSLASIGRSANKQTFQISNDEECACCVMLPKDFLDNINVFSFHEKNENQETDLGDG